MSHQKTKKTAQWFECQKCQATIPNKETEEHETFCPPKNENIRHSFIYKGTLCGILDAKSNEDIKNLSSRDKDNLVFVSSSAMQLCSFAIGENVLIGGSTPIVKKIWPTNEKSLTTVLLTKNCLEMTGLSALQYVTVAKFNSSPIKAAWADLVLLNGPKGFEITQELNNRLTKSHLGSILTAGNIISVMFYGKLLKFVIKFISAVQDIDISFEKLSLIEGYQFYIFDDHTRWKIYSGEQSFVEQNFMKPIVAGLDKEVCEITELVNVCLGSAKSIPAICSRSVLLYGNSGTGKTKLAETVAYQSKGSVVKLSPSDLYCNFSANPEEAIAEFFQTAIDSAPSILILDEIDILCPQRTGRLTDSEKRISSIIINNFDKLNTFRDSRVFIIATTNKLDNVEPCLRRYGRLDKEIEIPSPDPRSRRLILSKFLENLDNSLTEDDLLEIAACTHGFVGADLLSLCSQANLNATRRNNVTIQFEDLKLALKKIRPSAMREVQIEIANVKWSDIGGQDNLKLILKQAVEWPLKYPDSFKRLGVTPPRGVLMFGPPGCSKTMIAKALATESGLNFLSIKGPELFSKWVGESEKAIREVFRKAKQVAPSIVFFDEIDALGSERTSGSSASVQERVLAQLLTELDGVTPLGDVTILAATNRPDKIDKALLRPGRLDRIVYVPLPDRNTRMEIFRIKLSNMPTIDVILEELVDETEGYSGAEINAVCHEAAMVALEESLQIEKVNRKHFERALKLVRPRTSKSLLDLYQSYIELKL